MVSPIIALLLAVGALHAQAPAFQELMAPEMLPEAQMGMRVEAASRRGGAIRVITTGADVRINLAKARSASASASARERPWPCSGPGGRGVE